MVIRNVRAFSAGALFLVIGAGAAWAASDYRLGTASSMGPGYFPLVVGLLVALLGLCRMAAALKLDGPADRLDGWDLRRLGLILASLVAFALLLRPLGLQVALLAMLLPASFASRQSTIRSAVLGSLAIIIFCTVLFVYVLDMRIPNSLTLLPWL